MRQGWSRAGERGALHRLARFGPSGGRLAPAPLRSAGLQATDGRLPRASLTVKRLVSGQPRSPAQVWPFLGEHLKGSWRGPERVARLLGPPGALQGGKGAPGSEDCGPVRGRHRLAREAPGPGAGGAASKPGTAGDLLPGAASELSQPALPEPGSEKCPCWVGRLVARRERRKQGPESLSHLREQGRAHTGDAVAACPEPRAKVQACGDFQEDV